MNSKLGIETIPGYVDHLGIITNKPATSGSISVGEDLITYIPGDSDKGDDIIPILCNKSQFRSIRCSELSKALSNKVFFKEGLVYSEGGDNFKMKVSPGSLKTEIPAIHQVLSPELSKYADGVILKGEVNEEDIVSVEDKYSQLYSGNDKSGYDFIKYTTDNDIDLGDRPFTVNVVSAGSDVYTDTLNFNGIIYHCVSPGLKGMVNLDVRYSSSIGISTKNVVFQLFSYNEDLALESRNFIQNLDNKVQVEFIDGVLRVCPMSSNIFECIINNCTLTYAKS